MKPSFIRLVPVTPWTVFEGSVPIHHVEPSVVVADFDHYPPRFSHPRPETTVPDETVLPRESVAQR